MSDIMKMKDLEKVKLLKFNVYIMIFNIIYLILHNIPNNYIVQLRLYRKLLWTN